MNALDYLTVIRFSGTDCGDFLHNQLSSDVLALEDGESVFACYCEPKGRVLALMLVCRSGEDYYVILSNALAGSVSTRLKIFVMRSRVDIEVLNEIKVASLSDPDTPKPSALLNIPVPIADSVQSYSILSHDTQTDSNPSLSDASKALELDQGICWLCPDTSAQFLPQMLGFDQLGAVNFRKGCYPGQEIVARTHYLGKVKRHHRVLHSDSGICPKPLEKIKIFCDDQDYDAVIVDCGRNEEGRYSLFVVTRMDPELQAQKMVYQDQTFALS